MRRVILSCLVGILLSLPGGMHAAEGNGPSLLSTVWFEQPLHFTTPAGEPVIVPSGTYEVTAQGTQAIQLRNETQQAWSIHSLSAPHKDPMEQSVAIGLRDGSSPTLTHLVLATADGRLYFATGSTDGVMPRTVPTHIIVAMFKHAMTGSPVKPAMPVDQRSKRSGKPYRTCTLFAGMCELLCERDMDCRAFNWSGNAAKPVAGTCQLMKDIPPKQDDDCCLSGAKSSAQSK